MLLESMGFTGIGPGLQNLVSTMNLHRIYDEEMWINTTPLPL